MGDLAFKIEGVALTIRVLDKISNNLDKAIVKTSLKQANTLKDAISDEAKRGKTGTLKESVKVWQGYEAIELAKQRKQRVYYKHGGRNPLAVVVGMDRNVAFYAHMVEWGTSHSRAFPFFRRAIDGNAGKAANNMEADIKKRIERTV